MTKGALLALTAALCGLAPACLPVRGAGVSTVKDSTGGSGCGPDAFNGQSGPHYFDLKATIQADPAKYPNRRAVLAALPASMRQNFVLLYKSLSPQSATFDQPRIIYFSSPDNPDFLIGAAGADLQPEDSSLELIEFAAGQRRFCFRSIDFDANGPTFDDSPADCVGCHAPQGRPLWEPFNTWPGVYGSRDGKMGPGSAELAGFLKFQARPPTGTVYDTLVPPAGGMITAGPGAYTTFVNTDGSGNAASPLASFTTGLNRLNFQRLSQLLVDSPRFDRYKYAFLAAFLGCPSIDGFVPADQRANHPQGLDAVTAQTKSQVDAADAQREARINQVNFAAGADVAGPDQDSLNPDYLGTIASLRYLLENRQADGQGMATWSMSRLNNAFAFDSGTTGSTDLGFTYLGTAFSDNADLFNVANNPALFSSQGRKSLGADSVTGLCATLQTASLGGAPNNQ